MSGSVDEIKHVPQLDFLNNAAFIIEKQILMDIKY